MEKLVVLTLAHAASPVLLAGLPDTVRTKH